MAMLTLDGMLVWTNQPSAADCEDVGIGEHSFHCYRKDKFGVLLMAGSDHRCRFRWADVSHPGSASDLTAWLTSDVGRKLQDPNQTIVAPGLTIIGDKAFVESNHMAVLIPGKHVTAEEDAYNFICPSFELLLRGHLAFWCIDLQYFAHRSACQLRKCLQW
jgi:hypothetical protein